MEKQSRPGDAGSPGRSQDWEYRQVGQNVRLEIRALLLDERTNPFA